jgi:hypothetical protein
MDKKALAAPVKRVARVLVELDIHDGLLESIDIEWRGYLTRKNLDYLGIPFRCTYCRQTGHLRGHCTGFVEEEQSEDMMIELSSRLEYPGVNSHATFPDFFGVDDTTALDSLIGKLKKLCPSLFFSLTLWEKDLLDISTTLVTDLTTTHLGVTSIPWETTGITASVLTSSHLGITSLTRETNDITEKVPLDNSTTPTSITATQLRGVIQTTFSPDIVTTRAFGSTLEDTD